MKFSIVFLMIISNIAYSQKPYNLNLIDSIYINTFTNHFLDLDVSSFYKKSEINKKVIKKINRNISPRKFRIGDINDTINEITKYDFSIDIPNHKFIKGLNYKKEHVIYTILIFEILYNDELIIISEISKKKNIIYLKYIKGNPLKVSSTKFDIINAIKNVDGKYVHFE